MDKEKQYEMVCNACVHHLISVSFFRQQLKITNRGGTSTKDSTDYFPFHLDPVNIDHQFLLSQHAGNDFYYREDSSSKNMRLEYSHYKNLFHIFRNFFK